VPTAYGRAASRALRDAIARAKHDDPLAPVTVIVPTNSVGVAARRRLASGELGPLTASGRGVAGVGFLTVLRVAELLAAPALAATGRRPVSTPVVASAVRTVLAREPGAFAPVAHHPATEEALVAAHRELADLDDAQLDVLAARRSRVREVVRVHRATRARLAKGWYDERVLMSAATEAVESGHAFVAQLGTVVAFLPQYWSGPAARLLHALAGQADVVVIAALTGNARADDAVLASLDRIGLKVADNALAAIPPALGTEIVSASDADDEVRAVVRGVVSAMREGVPLERMAVLYGRDEPYARLVHEQLELAGINHNGASVRTLTDSVLGRGLLLLLALDDAAFARDAVGTLCGSAPVLDGHGAPVPAVAWDRIARAAGVVRGRDTWTPRLATYAAQLGAGDWSTRERARVHALTQFVHELAADLDAGRAAAAKWSRLARWMHGVIRKYFGTDARRARWPEYEQVAARRVEAIVDRLGTLDAVDPAPSLEAFRRALALELDAARDRVGRLGEGLLAGPVGFGLGVELERLWVCGLAEGVFPAVPHDDPLLADVDRAALADALRLRSARVDDDLRALLAAFAATTGPRVCTYARGDLRRSTERTPSRFLAPTRAVLDASKLRTIPSYVNAATQAEFPATEHELAVQAAARAEPWVEALPAVTRARELVLARASAAFTRFDGNLAGLGARLQQISPTAGRVVSPTSLEAWALCPHAYFVGNVLHVEAVERPEEIVRITPLERGSLVHDVLDRFVTEARTRADAGRPWTDADRARLHEIAHEAFGAVEARGLTGRPLLWQREQRLILAELDAFLAADEQYRNEFGARTLVTELPFGLPGADAPAVEVTLSEGRTVRVRGKADRIDRTDDGRLVVVDYKTGSPRSYEGLTHEHPVPGGTGLQLPVYAAAARAAYGAADTPVEAYYWFVGRGENERIGYPVDASVEGAFAAAVGTIVDGIDAGVFVGVPPEPGPRGPFIACRYCDPDGLGTADRWREWERTCEAPELAAYRALTEAVDDEEPE